MGFRVLADYHLRATGSFWAAFSILILTNIGLGSLIWVTPRQSCAIPTSQISPELGLAYQATVDCYDGRIYRFVTDSGDMPYASDLELFENDRPLGPRHSLHA